MADAVYVPRAVQNQNLGNRLGVWFHLPTSAIEPNREPDDNREILDEVEEGYKVNMTENVHVWPI